MKKSLLAGVLVIVGACASGSIAQAGTVIPYPNAGTINPEVYTFTATATGNKARPDPRARRRKSFCKSGWSSVSTVR